MTKKKWGIYLTDTLEHLTLATVAIWIYALPALANPAADEDRCPKAPISDETGDWVGALILIRLATFRI